MFTERVSEELGDILWYVANIATKAGLDLQEIARNNLAKTHDRWISDKSASTLAVAGTCLFDEQFPPREQLPRKFEVLIEEIAESDSVMVVLTTRGEHIGDHLTDNAYLDDGYRFHDVFHLGYAAVLGWSPVTRKLMRYKRKSNPKVDEVEDGGRAAAVEEAVCALVFDYASRHSFLEGVQSVDSGLLRTIKNLTSHLEVRRCPAKDWERAILQSFRVWRSVRQHRGGTVIGDLRSGAMEFQANQRERAQVAAVGSV